MSRLVIATTNAGKIIEIRSALGELPGWSLGPVPENTPSIPETGATFLDNAILKAEHYSKLVNDLTLADDSGLCVDALGGRPGVHSARYAPDPPSRIKRILEEMRLVPNGERNAVFFCALAVARAGTIIWTVQRDVAGVITHTASGTGGFGYDPLFMVPEYGKTLAELPLEIKNRISHRGRAAEALKAYLVKNGLIQSKA